MIGYAVKCIEVRRAVFDADLWIGAQQEFIVHGSFTSSKLLVKKYFNGPTVLGLRGIDMSLQKFWLALNGAFR